MSNTQTEGFEKARVIDSKTGETWWFVSLDGEDWLGVTEDPRGGDVEEVRTIFGISPTGTRPMRIARRALTWIGEVEFYGR